MSCFNPILVSYAPLFMKVMPLYLWELCPFIRESYGPLYLWLQCLFGEFLLVRLVCFVLNMMRKVGLMEIANEEKSFFLWWCWVTAMRCVCLYLPGDCKIVRGCYECHQSLKHMDCKSQQTAVWFCCRQRKLNSSLFSSGFSLFCTFAKCLQKLFWVKIFFLYVICITTLYIKMYFKNR